MKFQKAILTFVVSAFAAFAGHSQASVIDFIDSNPDKIVDATHTVSFIHDFTDQGFVFGTTNYISGTLKIRLTDSNSNEDGTIKYGAQSILTGNINNNSQDNSTPDGTFFTITLNSIALADLNADGKFSVSIASTNRIFYFADSTLTLLEPAVAASVPEPMSISLLAAGLMGVAAIRSHKTKS